MFTRIRDARVHAKELRYAKDRFEELVSGGVEPEDAADAVVLDVQKKFKNSINIESIMAIIAFIMQLMEMFKVKAVVVLLALSLVLSSAAPAEAGCLRGWASARAEARAMRRQGRRASRVSGQTVVSIRTGACLGDACLPK